MFLLKKVCKMNSYLNFFKELFIVCFGSLLSHRGQFVFQ